MLNKTQFTKHLLNIPKSKIDRLGINCQQRRMLFSCIKSLEMFTFYHIIHKIVCFMKTQYELTSPLCILRPTLLFLWFCLFIFGFSKWILFRIISGVIKPVMKLCTSINNIIFLVSVEILGSFKKAFKFSIRAASNPSLFLWIFKWESDT